ncbi:MAG: P1 family peptidase, partial [Rhodospirillaceae bacterium]
MPVSDPSTRSPSGRPRARGLGLPLTGTPGPENAITDVPGVRVGLTTLSDDAAPAIRTGVTAVLPRPAEDLLSPVWAGGFTMNGNGEMTGTHWIGEAGWFAGPVTLTNTLSLGVAHHATARWMVERFRPRLEEKNLWLLPVAAETFDGWLNDIYGQHVTEDHVRAAIDAAAPGPVAEGSVGGGTGMICYEFKGGTGTASRRVAAAGETCTLGVLVQANHGLRPWLTVCGRAVGEALPGERVWTRERGSIIVLIATDAPLLPIQLQRLARRAAIGIGRGGTPSGNNSGDIFLAFSTANNPGPLPEPRRLTLEALGNDRLDPLFLAVAEAVEEAVLNAMLAAEPCTGYKGRFVPALDGARL